MLQINYYMKQDSQQNNENTHGLVNDLFCVLPNYMLLDLMKML